MENDSVSKNFPRNSKEINNIHRPKCLSRTFCVLSKRGNECYFASFIIMAKHVL